MNQLVNMASWLSGSGKAKMAQMISFLGAEKETHWLFSVL
jgi:hypothetical protein